MSEVTLSAEAWAAIGVIVAPLVASAVSNMALRFDVRRLSQELKFLRESVTKEVAGVKKRVLTLEVVAKTAHTPRKSRK